MRTARFSHSFCLACLVCAVAGTAYGTLYVALEGDLRGEYTRSGRFDGELNSIGGSVRQVFADERGDRLTLFMRGEAAHDLTEGMLHQAYGEIKGPMGRWNVSLGRLLLPWGLLTGWSPDRMIYSDPYDWSATLASDNGIMLRGTVAEWDYGFALTQGYGMETIDDFPGPGNFTGRLGLTPGFDGDFNLGFSFAAGTVHVGGHGHDGDDVIEEDRTALALDTTWYFGRGAYRFEGGARKTAGRWHGTLFGTADYALFPKVTLQLAGQLYEHDRVHLYRRVFGGLSIPAKWFTIRGGYEYEKEHNEDHRVVVQFYRLFNIVR